jgi:hypothetical protein
VKKLVNRYYSLLTTGVVIAATTFTAYLVIGKDVALGMITGVYDIPGIQSPKIVTVQLTGRLSPSYLLVEDYPPETIEQDCWMVAEGEPKVIASSPVLFANHWETLQLPDWHWLDRLWRDWLKCHAKLEPWSQWNVGALIAGAVILLAGSLMIRGLTSVFVGTVAVAISWHLLVIGQWNHWINIPWERGWQLILPIIFLAGAGIGWRSSSSLARGLRCLLLTGILLLVCDDLFHTFRWPRQPMLTAAVLGTSLVPAVSVGLISTWLLAVGVNATPMVAHGLLATVLFAILPFKSISKFMGTPYNYNRTALARPDIRALVSEQQGSPESKRKHHSKRKDN